MVIASRKPLIGVETVSEEVISDPIPFLKEVSYDPNLNPEEQKVMTPGKLGHWKVWARVTRVNGREILRQELQRHLERTPVTEKIVRGGEPPKRSKHLPKRPKKTSVEPERNFPQVQNLREVR